MSQDWFPLPSQIKSKSKNGLNGSDHRKTEVSLVRRENDRKPKRRATVGKATSLAVTQGAGPMSRNMSKQGAGPLHFGQAKSGSAFQNHLGLSFFVATLSFWVFQGTRETKRATTSMGAAPKGIDTGFMVCQLGSRSKIAASRGISASGAARELRPAGVDQ